MNIHTKTIGLKRRPVMRSTFEWTEQNIAIAAKMWVDGYTSSSISERLGVSRGSVTAMASMHRDRFPSRIGPGVAKGNSTKDGKRVAIDPEWLKTASRLWMDGLKTYQIAAITGVKSGTAHHRIKVHPELFPANRRVEADIVPAAEAKTYIGNDRWVDRVPYTTFAGAVVSLPRVSILNGKEA